MPIRRRLRGALFAAALPLAALALAPVGATAADETAEGEEAITTAPYARGSVPPYQAPEPITRDVAASPGTAAAPVGAVESVRPVTIADPVYSDPDLERVRNDPYSLSRHTATQAGGTVTPYNYETD